MPSKANRERKYFSQISYSFNLLIKKETRIQIAPALNHSHINPKWSASCEPANGPSVCAADHAMVYSAAYSPRFPACVLLIQKLFINGMESISPKVTIAITHKASKGPIPGIFRRQKATPVIRIPAEM